MRVDLYNDDEFLASWNITAPTPPDILIWNATVYGEDRFFELDQMSWKTSNDGEHPVRYYETTRVQFIGKL